MKLVFTKLETDANEIRVTFDGSTWRPYSVADIKRTGYIEFTEEDCPDLTKIRVMGKFASFNSVEAVSDVELEQGLASRSLAESIQRIDSFIPTTVSETNKLVDESTLNDSLVDKVGDLSELTTTDKSNLVGAINEVRVKANSNVVNKKSAVASMGVDYRFDGENHLDFYVNDTPLELATMDNVVKNEVTTTTFINSNNKVYKQGKMCTATIMNLLLNTNYNGGEVLGIIGNSAFFPKDGIRGLVVQLNSGQASEIRINADGTITVGQATSLTSGYWVGNFSWVTN